jgi:hypothetical protein
MRVRASILIGAGLSSLLVAALLSAQVREAKAPEIKAPDANWKVPRTPWGSADLQGVWTSDDLQDVPVERPKEYGTRPFLTEQELAERDGRITRLIESAATGERSKEGFWASQKGVDAAAVPANRVEFARRASALMSLVSDPPDGRIPALTEEAQRLAASQPSYTNMRPQSYRDMTWYDRCVSRGVTAGFFPSIYGNGSEFVQTPDTVAIRYEMIHETRLIPLDNRPRNSSRMRSYMGEPRGHWEGDTLVVETKNFIGGRLAITFSPYSEDLTLVERFRRTGPQSLEYSVTVNDPRTYAAPWTATFPLTAEPGYQIFEYACHEGNYAMRNRLSAARAEEARDAAAGK